MKSADVTDSGIKIPKEWIKKIETINSTRINDWSKIDAFIQMYYGKKSINAIADSAGVSHETIQRRVRLLRKQQLLTK